MPPPTWSRQLDAFPFTLLLNAELNLSHTFGDACNGAAAYVHSHRAPDTAYHLVYDGPGVSLNITPQLIPVHLIRADGSPALTGHYMVNMITTHEYFVGSGRQTIPLTGYRDLEPGDILGTASAPLLRVPLEAVAQHDAPVNVATVAESVSPATPLTEITNAKPDPPDEPSPELLQRLDDDQRTAFLRLWNTVPPHIRRIDFALDAPGWEPSPRLSKNTRTFSPRPNWTMALAPYDRLKSRFRPGHNRLNRARTD